MVGRSVGRVYGRRVNGSEFGAFGGRFLDTVDMSHVTFHL